VQIGQKRSTNLIKGWKNSDDKLNMQHRAN